MDNEPTKSDPTMLTTTYMLREVGHLRDVITTRLEAMDKAMKLFETNITRVPTDTDKQIGHLKELHDEKFKSIDKQFLERDVRVEQTARDSKVAVDAALSAAKEAVGEQNKSSALAISKSEASTAKQIEALGISFNTTNNGLNDKMDDIRNRLIIIESRPQMMVPTTVQPPATPNYMAGLISLAGAIFLGMVVVASVILLRH